MKRKIAVFIIRWLLNAFGLWMAVRILGDGPNNLDVMPSVSVFLIGGLIFSIINAVLKPLFVLISLPIIVLTLGLFMVILNGFLVYISLKLTPGLSPMSFLNSIITGLILSLINYIIGAALVVRSDKV